MTVDVDLWVIMWVTFPSGPTLQSVVITVLSLHLLCTVAFFFIFAGNCAKILIQCDIDELQMTLILLRALH